MKLGTNHFPKSSFLSVEKDMALIVQKLLEDQTLLKYLYYSNRDAAKGEDLTDEQKMSLIGKQLKIIPEIKIDDFCNNYVIIRMDNFFTNPVNPEYRDCTISFDILCHPDHWQLENFGLRPFKIAGEIDSLVQMKKFSGIGELNFVGASHLVLNDTLMGLSLVYSAIHGVDDKINPL